MYFENNSKNAWFLEENVVMTNGQFSCPIRKTGIFDGCTRECVLM
jgi:hypothetical protein